MISLYLEEYKNRLLINLLHVAIALILGILIFRIIINISVSGGKGEVMNRIFTGISICAVSFFFLEAWRK